MLVVCYRWDTTSLTESPSFSEASPDGPSPTCEALLQAHEQQAAAAPMPRMDRALQQQQQHEGALQQARQGAQQLLQEMQEGLALQEAEQQHQQLPPLGKPRGTQGIHVAACNTLALPTSGLCMSAASWCWCWCWFCANAAMFCRTHAVLCCAVPCCALQCCR